MFQCPECSKYHSFVSNQISYFGCVGCNSVFNVKGIRPEKLLVSQPFEEDLSPIIIGTSGVVENRKFIVTGRIRYILEDSYLNQWTIVFDDSQVAFLGEYAGAYFIYDFKQDVVDFKKLANLHPGSLVSFKNKKKYLLTCYYKSERYECEGELITLPQHEKFILLEFSSDNREVAIVNLYSKLSLEVFTGKYYDFEELQLKNFRRL